MIDALKFVARAVGRRDLVKGLTHYRIKDGRCTGTNGVLTLSCPVDMSFDAAPHAGEFIKAISSCDGVVSMTLQDDGILVRSNGFKKVVQCIPLEDVNPPVPEGISYTPHASVIRGCRALEPFIATDASKPWACGLLLCGQSAYATNNIVIAEYWLGVQVPAIVNIPSLVLDELLAVGEELSEMQIAPHAITFKYADGRWIKGPLLDLSWPNIPGLLDHCWKGAQMQPVPAGLAEAVDKIAPFNERHKEHIYFRGSEVSTTPKGVEDGGATQDCIVASEGCYHTAHLQKVLAAASMIDFSRYPDAVPFTGDRVRGAMLGVRS